MKQELREKMKVAIGAIEQKEEKSISIFERMKSSKELSSAKNINCYLAREDEVQTKKIINYLLAEGKNVSVPYLTEDKKMVISIINEKSSFETSVFNLLKPTTVLPLDKDVIDIIIVPGLAFDEERNRLGRGFAYYDTFLENVNARKIALCFEEQIIDSVPTESHDVKMDMIITEKRVIV